MDVMKDSPAMKIRMTSAGRRSSTSHQHGDLVSLSFKVPLDFRLQFKIYATQNGLSMNELLREAFRRVMQEQRSAEAAGDS